MLRDVGVTGSWSEQREGTSRTYAGKGTTSMVAIRTACLEDADAICGIYAPYVVKTAVSFEEVPPHAGEIIARMTAIQPTHPYLVAVADGEVIGYAYASQHRARAAYRTSVDIAIYLEAAYQRRGIGHALLNRLLIEARERGFHAAFAGIAMPNEASVALHERAGFTCVGIYREVGRKFDAWHDVGWWQRLL